MTPYQSARRLLPQELIWTSLVPGLNNLVVVVYNKDVPGGTNPANPGTWNPAGLRFEILSSSILYLEPGELVDDSFMPPPPTNGEVPEPGTMFLLAAGFIALALLRPRK
jgi:hypothetical protein